MSALDLAWDLEMSSEKGKKGRRELTLKEQVDVIEWGTYAASSEAQHINVWLFFLIALLIHSKRTRLSFSSFPPKPFCIFTEVITDGLAKRLIDSKLY